MLIDANVFKGYFQMEVGNEHALCGCPQKLFGYASKDRPIFHDVGRIIEQEWRNVVDREWFDAWLAIQFETGVVSYMESHKCLQTEKQLQSKGFPPGRDWIYVRVGLKVANITGKCDFYTEDMDFYDPKMKGCTAKNRSKILTTSSGPVAKVLKKNNVLVHCVP